MVVAAPKQNEFPSHYADRLGQLFSTIAGESHRKRLGQFMTPVEIAGAMAKNYRTTLRSVRILDPGAGTGVLSCAICERLINQRKTRRQIHVTAFEVDTYLVTILREVYEYLAAYAKRHSVDFTYDIHKQDFVLFHEAALSDNRSLFANELNVPYDVAIANPPYFKIAKDDPRSRAARTLVHGQPNIYALFMGTSALLLRKHGKLIFIVPRSFASGPYFRQFRETFFNSMRPQAIHSYESRKSVFRRDLVLQENIILVASKDPGWQHRRPDSWITLSTSNGQNDSRITSRISTAVSSVLDIESPNIVLKIPTSQREQELLENIKSWGGSLSEYGLHVSTGPVVPFRATQYLVHEPSDQEKVVPLLWMHNIQPMSILWPNQKNGKQPFILMEAIKKKLLVSSGNYVLIRRFSAKEDKRRLIAAPVDAHRFGAPFLGLENHLNFVYSPRRNLSRAFVWGLATILNSSLMDEYFRIVNGSTQVSATELREMPMLPTELVENIGHKVLDSLCVKSGTTPNGAARISKLINPKMSKLLAYEQTE